VIQNQINDLVLNYFRLQNGSRRARAQYADVHRHSWLRRCQTLQRWSLLKNGSADMGYAIVKTVGSASGLRMGSAMENTFQRK
jgi:hypothetical protein